MRGIVAEQEIRAIIRKIARALSPQRIILFGSYGRGDPHEESDLNLCVVVPEAGDWLYRAHELRLRVPVDEVALEALVVTPTELETLLGARNPLAEAVAREGKVVYELE